MLLSPSLYVTGQALPFKQRALHRSLSLSLCVSIIHWEKVSGVSLATTIAELHRALKSSLQQWIQSGPRYSGGGNGAFINTESPLCVFHRYDVQLYYILHSAYRNNKQMRTSTCYRALWLFSPGLEAPFDYSNLTVRVDEHTWLLTWWWECLWLPG